MDWTSLLATLPFGSNLPPGVLASTLAGTAPTGAAPGGWMANYLPPPEAGGDVAAAIPGTPQSAPAPGPAPALGVLNGAMPAAPTAASASSPARPSLSNDTVSKLLAQAKTLIAPPQEKPAPLPSGPAAAAPSPAALAPIVQPSLAPIEMARAAGVGAGVDPRRLVAAMRGV
jgi:hypothetical protein